MGSQPMNRKRKMYCMKIILLIVRTGTSVYFKIKIRSDSVGGSRKEQEKLWKHCRHKYKTNTVECSELKTIK